MDEACQILGCESRLIGIAGSSSTQRLIARREIFQGIERRLLESSGAVTTPTLLKRRGYFFVTAAGSTIAPDAGPSPARSEPGGVFPRFSFFGSGIQSGRRKP
jgi:hypothetical protein